MESRRQFLKKGVYVAPVVLSLAVRPAVAGTGYRPNNHGGGGGGGSSNSTSHSGGGNPPWWAVWRDL